MDKKILMELGLTSREILVYVSLLKLGLTTTGPIVKKSKVPNSKIYEILNKLLEKSLVSYIYVGKIKYFKATEPKALLKIIDNKRDILKKQVEELSSLQKKETSDYQATIYEGIRALEGVFLQMYDSIGTGGEYYVFPLGEQLGNDELINFWRRVFYTRQKMKIKVKTLPNKSLKKIFKKHYENYKNLTVRYTNQQFPTGIFIFRNYVLNIIWKEVPIGFLIKSKENYEIWKRFFDEQWELSIS